MLLGFYLYLESGVELGRSFPLLELGDGVLHASRVLGSRLSEDSQEGIASRHGGGMIRQTKVDVLCPVEMERAMLQR